MGFFNSTGTACRTGTSGCGGRRTCNILSGILGTSRSLSGTGLLLRRYHHGRVRVVSVCSDSCPVCLGGDCLPPQLLFVTKREVGLDGCIALAIMKDHRTASGNGGVTCGLTHSLARRNFVVVDKVTRKVSICTRGNTLSTNNGAVTILTKKTSVPCPTIRQNVCSRVLGGKTIVSRRPPKATNGPCLCRGHGHVVSNLSCNYVVIRNRRGDNASVAVGRTASSGHSVFTMPKGPILDRSCVPGDLVGSNTALMASCASVLGVCRGRCPCLLRGNGTLLPRGRSIFTTRFSFPLSSASVGVVGCLGGYKRPRLPSSVYRTYSLATGMITDGLAVLLVKSVVSHRANGGCVLVEE